MEQRQFEETHLAKISNESNVSIKHTRTQLMPGYSIVVLNTFSLKINLAVGFLDLLENHSSDSTYLEMELCITKY